jgi:hypothetical protein
MKNDVKAVKYVPVFVQKRFLKWLIGLILKGINPLRLLIKVNVLVVPFVPGCVRIALLKFINRLIIEGGIK